MRPSRLDIDRVPAQFPGPVTLHSSRLKWSVVFLLSALFTVGGVWQWLDGDRNGLFVFGFFGLSSIIAATVMLPGARALILSGDAFETKTLFRGNRSRWRDVSGFTVVSFQAEWWVITTTA